MLKLENKVDDPTVTDSSRRVVRESHKQEGHDRGRFMYNKSSLLRAIALAFFFVGSSLHAAVVFENLNTPDDRAEISSSFWYAQSFVVSADSTLTSVVVNMESVTMPADPGGNFFVRIYDVTETFLTPGVSLAELVGDTNPFEDKNYVFTSAGTLNLNANTAYYVVLGVSSGGAHYNWGGENSSSIEAGSTIGLSVSFDAGGGWEMPDPIAAFNMQVNAEFSPVPEPANTALGIFGMLLISVQSFLWWKARRRQIDPLTTR